ncbi:MAG: glycerophosphoryl diester phosphodiesterase [Actinomycetia bacterium]|nr:glycerophosphoryl diester phosphodiesterase [Actinomycetes bacterium]
MKVLAHRGASRRAAENTLEAFEIARELGADGVELDVHASGDQVLVVHHDAEADGLGVLHDFSVAEITALRPDIPTLETVLERCAGMLVNVELKNLPGDADFDPNHGIAVLVVELLQDRAARGASDSVIVSSFNLETIDRVHADDASVPTGFLTFAGLDPVFALTLAAERGHTALHPQLQALAGDAPGVVERAHELGLHVNVWTVNDPDDVRALRDAGADAVITDVADVALAALGRR